MGKDPILKEFKFCHNCEPKVAQLIEYIRNLEDAAIVAKQAVETLSLLNQKLTMDKNHLVKKLKRMDDQLAEKSATRLKSQMDKLDNAHQQFVNREKLV